MSSKEESHKIVFSFTTSPLRIEKCLTMVNSIINQTLKPDLILLNIPEVFARTGETYNIPERIKDLVTINVCDFDYGPGTKIVPTIGYLRENKWPDDSIVIFGDDDIRYPEDMIDTYVNFCDDHSVWCVSGFNLSSDGTIEYNPNKIHGNRITIAEGYAGICCRLKMFGDDFQDHIFVACESTELRLSDDIAISNYLWMRKIPIRLCSAPFPRMSLQKFWSDGCVLEYGCKGDALHHITRTDDGTARYVIAINTLNNNTFPINRYFPLGDQKHIDTIPKIIHKIVIVDGGDMPDLSSTSREALNSFSEMNPEYEVRVYTGKDCETYIEKHYDKTILTVFKSLIPYAFQADFFRYLVLYKEGGIYSDFRQVCLKPFKEYIPDNASWFSVTDNPVHNAWKCPITPMYNGIIAAAPNQPVFKTAINMIIANFSAWQIASNKTSIIPISPKINNLASLSRKIPLLGTTGPILFGYAFLESPPIGNIFIGKLEFDPSNSCGLEIYDHNGKGGFILCKHAAPDDSQYTGADWNGKRADGGNNYGDFVRRNKIFMTLN